MSSFEFQRRTQLCREPLMFMKPAQLKHCTVRGGRLRVTTHTHTTSTGCFTNTAADLFLIDPTCFAISRLRCSVADQYLLIRVLLGQTKKGQMLHVHLLRRNMYGCRFLCLGSKTTLNIVSSASYFITCPCFMNCFKT